MTLFWTVVTGTSVFVLGQMTKSFVIDPVHEYRMLVGRIAHACVFYLTANTHPLLVSPATPDQARKEMRSLAGELLQRTTAIPLYDALAVIRVVPAWPRIDEAYSNLIGYSNRFGVAYWGGASAGEREKRRQVIYAALGIRLSGTPTTYQRLRATASRPRRRVSNPRTK